MSATADAGTEVVSARLAAFPRARLAVSRGSDKGRELWLEGQSLVVGTDPSCELRLSDPSISRRHLELSSERSGYRVRDLRSTNGVFLDDVQVFEAQLRGRARLRLGRTEICFEPEREDLEWPLSPFDRFGGALGRSTAMRRVFALLQRAAPTDVPIVLEGEPGTGKKLLARAVHEASARRESPFVVLDVGAFSSALVESELFGHPPGPFAPRAPVRPGALEEARGGTLLIDGIHLLAAPAQARLLRALETRRIERRGGAVDLDVRVIVTSEADLEEETRAGRFREDLLLRLSVLRLKVPALRERSEDVPLLARAIQARLRPSRRIPAETIEILGRHDWPGNVRELCAVVERLCALPDLGAGAVDLPAVKPTPADVQPSAELAEQMKPLVALPFHSARQRVLESFEQSYFSELLRLERGVVQRAALRARLPRQTVHRMIRRHRLRAQ